MGWDRCMVWCGLCVCIWGADGWAGDVVGWVGLDCAGLGWDKLGWRAMGR